MAWLSLIPAFITVILTFKTKKLIPSLFAGVVIGSFIKAGSLFDGMTSVGNYIVSAVSNKESIYTLAFLIAFGSLSDLIEMSGGISGFSDKVGKRVKSERGVFIWAWLLSIITFFDSSFHMIAVGTILKPLLQRVNAAKEKFAFILSVTSLQLIEIIPIATGFLGYMVTVVSNNIKGKGIEESAYTIFLNSILWNFFPWVMLTLALGVSLFGLGFGKVRLGRIIDNDKEFTQKHLQRDKCLRENGAEYPKRSRNLILPVAFLLLSTIFLFWWTGRAGAVNFFDALSSAKFNVAILAGALFTLLVTGLYYLLQGISLAEIDAHIASGGEKVLSLVIVLVLSWALTAVTQELGFNTLLSGGIVQSIPRFLIPSLVFFISALISYTVGSSWATWALVMPLAVNFSITTGINLPLMVGTVWSGGAVADVISPLAAEMADISFGLHLSTAFPYLIAGVFITAIGYLSVGLLI